ncbi:hypothetical protein [Salinivirga cyanobacteriivorans]|uniref:TonB-linked outer membrane protein, SusC/RagA family n=1 Tax=Salinivirga cyanobacteriivorans TaxID=1307839 RepID=A0A0S2HVC6_9BACT|nr:hypothetical protein [Salinivirga cyanobacteriivorans]ALO14013.1 TonB-linked outer membrane protein, SusC/RagA family [Salinivirga cyanobacteriivorans]
MKTGFITVLLIILAFSVEAQVLPQDTIPFSGIVFDENKKVMPNTHILINGNKGTMTSPGGFFQLKVNALDTLTFSYVGYKKFHYVIPDSMSRLGYITGVFMTRDTMSLPEVIVLPYLNKQQFKQAFINKNDLTRNQANAKANLSLVGTKGQRKYSYMQSTGVELQMEQFKNSMEYKGLISPDDMVGVNVVPAIGYVYNILRWNKTQEKQEEKIRNRLLRYKAFLEQKEED